MESHCSVCICIVKDVRMLLDDYDDLEETLEWASSVHGWSKRNRSLENML